jgi:hypothetical protein
MNDDPANYISLEEFLDLADKSVISKLKNDGSVSIEEIGKLVITKVRLRNIKEEEIVRKFKKELLQAVKGMFLDVKDYRRASIVEELIQGINKLPENIAVLQWLEEALKHEDPMKFFVDKLVQ